jgi:hypothetical protein
MCVRARALVCECEWCVCVCVCRRWRKCRNIEVLSLSWQGGRVGAREAACRPKRQAREPSSLCGCCVEEEYLSRRTRRGFLWESWGSETDWRLHLRHGQVKWRDQGLQWTNPTTSVVVQASCNEFHHDHHQEQTTSCLRQTRQLSVTVRLVLLSVCKCW